MSPNFGIWLTEILLFCQDKQLLNAVLDRINPDSLRNFLKTLSREPHVAASDRDRSAVTCKKFS